MSSFSEKYIPDEDANGLFFSHLTLNGDGTTRDMNVDGSVTPQYFYWGPAAGKVGVVSSFAFEMTDAKNWSLAEFANLGSALTNGLAIELYDTVLDSVVADFTDGEDIKSNQEFYQYFYDASYDDWGSGDTEAMLHGHLNLNVTIGAPLIIKDDLVLRVGVLDNLTAVTKLHFNISGFYGVGRPGKSGTRAY